MIRLGPDGDGGYLVPDDLNGIQACFSAGVGPVSGFEKECARRGMDVFLADNSVDQPAETHERFCFTKKHVGLMTSRTEMTMDRWVTDSLPASSGDILLQMDIEDAEYEVLLSMSDQLMRRFRVIVAEFHGLERLWSQDWFNLSSRVLGRVLQTHVCVHVHPNNTAGSVRRDVVKIPRAAEFTFLRKDRISDSLPASIFPHPLDRKNAAGPDLKLPAYWYQTG